MSKYYIVEEVRSMMVCTKINTHAYTRIYNRMVIGYFDNKYDADKYCGNLKEKYPVVYNEDSDYDLVVREIESNIEPSNAKDK